MDGLAWKRRRVLLDPLALVLNSDGRLLQFIQVLVCVVPTEKKLAVWHDHSHVGLCATGITTICGCQSLLVSHYCVHINIKAFKRENIPEMGCEFTRGRIFGRHGEAAVGPPPC